MKPNPNWNTQNNYPYVNTISDIQTTTATPVVNTSAYNNYSHFKLNNNESKSFNIGTFHLLTLNSSGEIEIIINGVGQLYDKLTNLTFESTGLNSDNFIINSLTSSVNITVKN